MSGQQHMPNAHQMQRHNLASMHIGNLQKELSTVDKHLHAAAYH